jgi:hypothetical protein
MIFSVPPQSLPSEPRLNHRNFELYCFVFDDDPRQVFPVKIAITESVGTLMKAIKEKKKPSLHHVDADALTLWKVSIPVNVGFNPNVKKVELRDEEALSPVDRLCNIFFVQPKDGHLHIIMRSPPASKSTGECA